MNGQLLIQINNISKIYKMTTQAVVALDNVSLSIKEGEYVAIKGPSGSGKSTLLHIIGCLDTPTTGTYKFYGQLVSNLSDDELSKIRNKEIGFVFQFFNLIPEETALHNVELPLIYSNVPRDERRKRAYEALSEVNMIHRILHRPNELSGGECQRVAIARALANNPKLILSDEPTGNLDSKTGEEIISLLGRLHEEGRTVLVVTHERSIAEKTDRIVRLKDGRIEE